LDSVSDCNRWRLESWVLWAG